MAYLMLESTNPHLSYIVRKNPATTMVAKNIRHGTMFGWFPPDSTQQYCILFRDALTTVSYAEEGDSEFEFGNQSRYNSPMFVLDALAEFLASAYKTPAEQDVSEEYTSSLTLGSIALHEGYLEIFERTYTDFQFTVHSISKGVYSLQIHTKRPIRELLNFVLLFGMFHAIKTQSLFLPKIQEDQIQKYLNCITLLEETPYLIRYVFKLTFLFTEKMFKKYSDQLALWPKHTLTLTHGSANDARIRFVREHVRPEENVIDIGCGDGQHLIQLLKKRATGVVYYGIDPDNDMIEIFQGRLKRREIEDVYVVDSVLALSEQYDVKEKPFVVLLIEVIEHMEVDEAKILMQMIFECINASRLILTTPNKGFNVHYNLENDKETRRSDHKFEFYQEEFVRFLLEILPKGWKFRHPDIIEPLGDCVDGIYAQHAVVLEKIVLNEE